MHPLTPSQFFKAWAIVIFVARETIDVLMQSVRAASIAGQGRANIDVMVNGNPELAHELAGRLAQGPVVPNAPVVNVWSIAQGDKANAWNQYIHGIWSGQSIAFFIDGYVRLNPDAVELLGDAITADPSFLGGTGIPCVGRSAQALRASMVQHGGFHGNFCCVTRQVIEQLRDRHIELPFGLYRVDGLIGALLSFGLDPINNEWNPHRVLVHPTASWQTNVKHWWRFNDLKDALKRMFRQTRGLLENKAVTHHFLVRKLSPEQLPASASSLVLGWAERCPVQVNALCQHNLLAKQALHQFRHAQPLAPDKAAPTLVLSTAPA